MFSAGLLFLGVYAQSAAAARVSGLRVVAVPEKLRSAQLEDGSENKGSGAGFEVQWCVPSQEAPNQDTNPLMRPQALKLRTSPRTPNPEPPTPNPQPSTPNPKPRTPKP